ncbi:MAG: 2-hydroxychromene-2-carboxylate isomerase [Candidatus Binatia bacterium]
MKTVDFYFDFMSPYAYLAAQRLPDLRERYGKVARFVVRPIALVEARFKAGNTGPFNRDQPAKMKCLMLDLQRWAKRYGVKMGFPKGLETARLNRGYLAAEREGKADAYLKAGFDAVWAESGDPSDEKLIRDVAAKAGVSPDGLLKAVDSPEIVAEYEKGNLAAQARGVFGVPIFMVDDQIYWGNDRIEFLEEHLRAER